MHDINETAAAGSTSAGSIAVVPSNRLGGMQTRMSLKDFMLKFHKGISNRYNFKFISEISNGSITKIMEAADFPNNLASISSKLKNAEMQGRFGDESDTVAYGIQDDTGNIMVITVPLEQGDELERHVAQCLADVLEFKKTGRGEDKSLAELLYTLKDEFNVINAEFPTIPKDAVYNEDEITKGQGVGLDGNDENDVDFDDENGDMDMDNPDMDNMGDMDMDNPEDGEMSDDGEMDFDDGDEEIGDDFESADSKEELLVAILGMLKAQNEKEKAQAEAEKAKAEAEEAKMALQASKAEMKSQEEMVAAQAELDAEKEKEKRAKEMAELAKFNYKKRKGLNEEDEGFSSIFKSVVLEFDNSETPQSLRRQLANLDRKWAPEPNDSPDTIKYKHNQKRLEQQKLRSEMQAAKNRMDHESEIDSQEAQRTGNEETDMGSDEL